MKLKKIFFLGLAISVAFSLYACKGNESTLDYYEGIGLFEGSGELTGDVSDGSSASLTDAQNPGESTEPKAETT